MPNMTFKKQVDETEQKAKLLPHQELNTSEAGAPKLALSEPLAQEKLAKGQLIVYRVNDSMLELVPGLMYDEKNIVRREGEVVEAMFTDKAWFKRLVDTSAISQSRVDDAKNWKQVLEAQEEE